MLEKGNLAFAMWLDYFPSFLNKTWISNLKEAPRLNKCAHLYVLYLHGDLLLFIILK